MRPATNDEKAACEALIQKLTNSWSEENSRELIEFIDEHQHEFNLAAIFNDKLLPLKLLLIKGDELPNKYELLQRATTLPGIDLSVIDHDMDTALHWAAYKGDLPAVNLLLATITDKSLLTKKNAAGNTPIQEANRKTKSNTPAIVQAINDAIAGKKPVVTNLVVPRLRKAAPYEIDEFNACLRDPKQFDRFIQENKNRFNVAALIKQTKIKDVPVLIHLTRHASAESYLRSLITVPNIDYGVTDSNGDTALHWAAWDDRVAVVETLLSAISNSAILQKKNNWERTVIEDAQVHKKVNAQVIIDKITQAIAGKKPTLPDTRLLPTAVIQNMTPAEMKANIERYHSATMTPAEHYQLATQIAHNLSNQKQKVEANTWFDLAVTEALTAQDFRYFREWMTKDDSPVTTALTVLADKTEAASANLSLLANIILGFDRLERAKKAKQMLEAHVTANSPAAEYLATLGLADERIRSLVKKGNLFAIAGYEHSIQRIHAKPDIIFPPSIIVSFHECRPCFSPDIIKALEAIFSNPKNKAYYDAVHAALGLNRPVDLESALISLKAFLESAYTTATYQFYLDTVLRHLTKTGKTSGQSAFIADMLAIAEEVVSKSRISSTNDALTFLQRLLQCYPYLSHIEDQLSLAKTLVLSYAQLAASTDITTQQREELLQGIRSLNLTTLNPLEKSQREKLAEILSLLADSVSVTTHEKISLLDRSAYFGEAINPHIKLAKLHQADPRHTKRALAHYMKAMQIAVAKEDTDSVNAMLELLADFTKTHPRLSPEEAEALKQIRLHSFGLAKLGRQQQGLLQTIFDDTAYTNDELLTLVTQLHAGKKFDFSLWALTADSPDTKRRKAQIFTNLLLQEKKFCCKKLPGFFSLTGHQKQPDFAKTYDDLYASAFHGDYRHYDHFLEVLENVTLATAPTVLAAVATKPVLTKSEGRALKRLVGLHYLPAILELAPRFAMMGRQRRTLYLYLKAFIMLSGDPDTLAAEYGYNKDFIETQKAAAESYILAVTNGPLPTYRNLANYYLSSINNFKKILPTTSEPDAWLLNAFKLQAPSYYQDLLMGMIQATGNSSNREFEKNTLGKPNSWTEVVPVPKPSFDITLVLQEALPQAINSEYHEEKKAEAIEHVEIKQTTSTALPVTTTPVITSSAYPNLTTPLPDVVVTLPANAQDPLQLASAPDLLPTETVASKVSTAATIVAANSQPAAASAYPSLLSTPRAASSFTFMNDAVTVPEAIPLVTVSTAKLPLTEHAGMLITSSHYIMDALQVAAPVSQGEPVIITPDEPEIITPADQLQQLFGNPVAVNANELLAYELEGLELEEPGALEMKAPDPFAALDNFTGVFLPLGQTMDLLTSPAVTTQEEQKKSENRYSTEGNRSAEAASRFFAKAQQAKKAETKSPSLSLLG